MNSKQIDKKTCRSCESEYKLIYDTAFTSGFPKFCPFCSSEYEEEEDLDDFYMKNDDEE